MSILSAREDGVGFFYGFAPGDNRQINVRFEGGPTRTMGSSHGCWIAYVGGKKIGLADSKTDAEELALKWMAQNP